MVWLERLPKLMCCTRSRSESALTTHFESSKEFEKMSHQCFLLQMGNFGFRWRGKRTTVRAAAMSRLNDKSVWKRLLTILIIDWTNDKKMTWIEHKTGIKNHRGWKHSKPKVLFPSWFSSITCNTPQNDSKTATGQDSKHTKNRSSRRQDSRL